MNTLKNTLIILLVSIKPILSSGQALASIDENDVVNNFVETKNYDAWSKILRKNASVVGAINYTGFKRDHREFNRILKDLATTEVKRSWTRKAELAHWINVYNAYSIKLISDHFPAKTLAEIGKVEKIKFFEIKNEMMSLHDLEAIIKTYGDVRALLVLHRGAKSAIKINKNAYTAENLEETLDKRVRVFIHNQEKNNISAKEAKVSSLIKNYKKEIDKEYGSIKKFLNTYSKISLNYGQKIEFINYNDTIDSYQQTF